MYVPLGAVCCTVLLYSKTGINIPKTLKHEQCILVCVFYRIYNIRKDLNSEQRGRYTT